MVIAVVVEAVAATAGVVVAPAAVVSVLALALMLAGPGCVVSPVGPTLTACDAPRGQGSGVAAAAVFSAVASV